MNPFKKGKSPTQRSIESMVEWLEELGLSVYGQAVDLNDGQVLDGLMDYNSEKIHKLQKLTRSNKLWIEE